MKLFLWEPIAKTFINFTKIFVPTKHNLFCPLHTNKIL